MLDKIKDMKIERKGYGGLLDWWKSSGEVIDKEFGKGKRNLNNVLMGLNNGERVDNIDEVCDKIIDELKKKKLWK